MAESDRPPVHTHAVVDDKRIITTPWYRFFQAIARRILNASQVATITTSDISASTIAVSSSDVSALTDPLVTSADAGAAGAGYVQATAATWVTLMNELKTDVNAIVTVQNTDRTLVNECKADINSLVAQFNTMATLVNELKSTVNEITAALDE